MFSLQARHLANLPDYAFANSCRDQGLRLDSRFPRLLPLYPISTTQYQSLVYCILELATDSEDSETTSWASVCSYFALQGAPKSFWISFFASHWTSKIVSLSTRKVALLAVLTCIMQRAGPTERKGLAHDARDIVKIFKAGLAIQDPFRLMFIHFIVSEGFWKDEGPAQESLLPWLLKYLHPQELQKWISGVCPSLYDCEDLFVACVIQCASTSHPPPHGRALSPHPRLITPETHLSAWPISEEFLVEKKLAVCQNQLRLLFLGDSLTDATPTPQTVAVLNDEASKFADANNSQEKIEFILKSISEYLNDHLSTHPLVRSSPLLHAL